MTTTTEDESVITVEFVSVQMHLPQVQFNTWLYRWPSYWEWIEGHGKARCRPRDYVYHMNENNGSLNLLVPNIVSSTNDATI